MGITIISYGSLIDVLGQSLTCIATDTDELITHIHQKYPNIKNKRFVIAVNNTIIKKNTVLRQGDQVALMPPYSGG
ncbi:MoaD/ThiS family protein [Sphingobacterium shayense]|uniref:MoaD/ThiS family protein n=1 Tax=Sphingobacterium shayense TaxID=626343 RepID=UPI00155723B2|nr:MoaD/ThiS family protein [Sphingobacterium shayense]NQD69431.1 MoaD/ThiS family protein [Sphingobacterium shayense]